MNKKGILIAGLIAAVVAGFCMGFGWRNLSNGSVHAPLEQQEAEDLQIPTESQIKNVVLDIDAAEVRVQKGEQNRLIAGNHVTWKLNEDQLMIEEKSKAFHLSSHPTPVILILQDNILENLDIDLDAGSVTVNDIQVKQRVTCDVDAGSVRLVNVDAGHVEMDIDAGSIQYSGRLYGSSQVNCDAGSVHLGLKQGSMIGRIAGELDIGKIRVLVNDKTVINKNGISQSLRERIDGAKGEELLTVDCDTGTVVVNITSEEKQ